MSDRIANVIILAEDQEHQNLVRRYLLRCGRGYSTLRLVALPAGKGCGSQYVRNRFSEQVAKCRETLGRRASCLLIVVTDADDLSTIEREQTLQDELIASGQNAVAATEPIVILIPKWQIETWIKCLLGQSMLESDKDSDRPPVTGQQVAQAAITIFDWARPNAQVGSNCVPSLSAALPHWLRIG